MTYVSPAAFADSTGSVTTRRRAARGMISRDNASCVPSGDGAVDYQWTD